MPRVLRYCGLALFGVILAGCAIQQKSSNEAVAGTYVVTLTKDQIFAAGGNSIVAAMAQGPLQLELATDGMSRISTHNSLGWSQREQGLYHISGDRLVFEPQTGKEACLEGVTGTYTWRLDGDKLYMTVVEDECVRRFVLAAAPWIRQP